MVKDPYNYQDRYENWKREVEEFGITGLSKTNSDILKRYVFDMEAGDNVARGIKKGKRGYHRLNVLRIRLKQVFQMYERAGIKDIKKLTPTKANAVFNDLRTGKITKANGGVYTSIADFGKDVKAFWHWYMKVSRRDGKAVEDVTIDIDTSRDENKFVYFDKDQMEKMLPYFKPKEQTLLLFCFDVILRTGKELTNIKVSDIHGEELSIRGETSKTYGRTIKLLLCKDALDKHIKENKLKPDDYLFDYSSAYLNRKLKTVAVQLFGDTVTKGGRPFSQISLYDYRHSGSCHWRLGPYRSKIDALMYRGGWSNLTMLNYYTKKLGMRDSIEKEDLLVGVDKTEMDKEIIKLKAESKESKEIISGILKYIQGGGDHIVFQNDKTGELIGFGKEELPKNAVVKVNNQKTSLS